MVVKHGKLKLVIVTNFLEREEGMMLRNALCRFFSKSVILFAASVLALTTAGFSAGESEAAATKYPIVLAHGMGASAEILGILDYWWGLEDVLREEGADVYVTSVNGMDSTAAKAADFKQQYLEILAISGQPKANIIGHSHGTIYTRYAISNLGLGTKVASYSSIAGPHRGSVVADAVVGLIPDSLEWLVGDTLDFIYAFIFGDSDPDSLQNGYDLTRANMINNFNPNTPNVAGIYYQSWAAKIKTMAINARNWYFIGTWPLLLAYEGANDGLVSVNSAKWGTFRGVEDASWYSAGCDHLNIIGQPLGVTPGFDRDEFYLDLAAELKGMGY
jgi:triacylglycerol lipase